MAENVARRERLPNTDVGYPSGPGAARSRFEFKPDHRMARVEATDEREGFA